MLVAFEYVLVPGKTDAIYYLVNFNVSGWEAGPGPHHGWSLLFYFV